MEQRRISADDLRGNVARIFGGLGLSEGDASTVADSLVEADLMGVSSHGVSNYIELLYEPALRGGLVDKRSLIEIVRETPTMALVDGGGAMGHLVATRAMEIAIEKARATGVGIVVARGSQHFGAAGVYSKRAVVHDMIGVAMTNADPLVVPLHGSEVRFGTNPIAVAVPTGEESPFLLDMATSTVPLGRLMLAARAGQKIPLGWALDEDGHPTSDPSAAFRAKRLRPLGSTLELGGHKGQGLAMVVDIASGLLSGAGVLHQVSATTQVGHFFAAMRIDGLRDIDEFKAEMDAYVRAVAQTPEAPDSEPVIYAGVKEARARADRAANGIPLHADVFTYLTSLASELGVEWSDGVTGDLRGERS